MKKFEKELKETKNPWIKRIGEYLLSRNDLHENLKKENKSLKECFDYILVELSKKCVKDGGVGYVAGDDEELFAMAVHYYDEDDVKAGNKNFRTNADGSATKSDMKQLNSGKEKENNQDYEKIVKDKEKEIKNKDKEIKKLKNELDKKQEVKPIKKEKKNKNSTIEGQMSLFEV